MSDLLESIRSQLAEWDLLGSAEGQTALDIASRLTDDTRPAAAAMLHGQLRGILAQLRVLAPEPESHDEIDEVREQREKRRREAGTA